MSFVLDASITVARLNQVEATPAVMAVFDRLADERAYVPSLWWLEIGNALQMGLRRKRYTRAECDEYYALLRKLPLSTDDRSVELTWQTAVALSDRCSLTVYDAAYLELAMRRGVPLATLDRALRVAAAGESVQLLGL